MSNLAIIPARGGSKRIPRKNIKDFLGKPIIAYSIEAALNSELFDEVMVSTDDEEIAEIALKYGAKVPFLRSKENSDDFAGTVDVIREVLDEYSKRNIFFKYACCIYPTAPLIQVQDLKLSFDLLCKGGNFTVFPVVRFGYPVMRGLELYDNNKIMAKWPENINKRSQDLSPIYHDAGQYYWIIVDSFQTNPVIFTDNTGAIILDELFVQDIDTETDWKLAEHKFRIIHER